MNLTDHQQAAAWAAVFVPFCVWLIWSCVRDEMRRDRNDRRHDDRTEWSQQR